MGLGRKIAVGAAAFTVYAVFGVALQMFGIFYVELVSHLDTTKEAASLAGSLQVGLLFATGIFGGSLIEVSDCHIVASAGSLLVGTGFILSAFATNVYILCVTIGLISGVGLGFQFLSVAVSIQRLFPATTQNAVIGIAMSGYGTGAFIYAPCLRHLIDVYGWRGSYAITGAIFLNAVAAGWLLRTRNQSNKNSQESGEESDPSELAPTPNALDANSMNSQDPCDSSAEFDYSSHDTCNGGSVKKLYLVTKHTEAKTKETSSSHTTSTIYSEKNDKSEEPDSTTRQCHVRNFLKVVLDFSLLRNTTFRCYLATCFVFRLGLNVPYAFMSSKALINGFTAYEASYLVSAMGISNTLGRITIGLLTLRLSSLVVLVCAFSVIGIVYLFSPITHSYTALMVTTSIYGFSYGGFAVAQLTSSTELLGADVQAKAVGFMYTFVCLAAVASYPFAAFLWEASGNPEAPFLLTGVTSSVSAICMAAIVIKHRASTRERDSQNQTI